MQTKEIRIARRRRLSDEQKRLAYVTFADVLNEQYDEARVFRRGGKVIVQPMRRDGSGERA